MSRYETRETGALRSHSVPNKPQGHLDKPASTFGSREPALLSDLSDLSDSSDEELSVFANPGSTFHPAIPGTQSLKFSMSSIVARAAENKAREKEILRAQNLLENHDQRDPAALPEIPTSIPHLGLEGEHEMLSGLLNPNQVQPDVSSQRWAFFDRAVKAVPDSTRLYWKMESMFEAHDRNASLCDSLDISILNTKSE
ncbi:hypothetical protein ABW19_dt0210472 [Dactylella cylindrospora]|nr:hypothetical protein ABW19_dt0210472 [Dactylella cylindrospora]